MSDIPHELEDWLEAGRSCALAVVVDTWSSAPRPAGAMMAVSADGEVIGSLSGGCVEGAVCELAQECLESGVPQLAHYGVSDDDAFAVGLACGGRLDVLVAPVHDGVRPALLAFVRAAGNGSSAALALPLPDADGADSVGSRGADDADRNPDAPERAGGGPAALAVTASGSAGSLGNERLTEHVVADVQGFIAMGRTGIREYDSTGQRLGAGTRVFITCTTPPPRLIIFGAIDYSAALAQLGRFLGYDVTVCDARPLFATAKRLPAAHRVEVAWPHRYLAGQIAQGRVTESTVIAVLTHDLKFDVPALIEAVRSPAGFVGALGSRRTQAKRVEALREAGATHEEIARIHAPLGLDLGSRTPQETAVSIFAEVLQEKNGTSARALMSTSGPIHTSR